METEYGTMTDKEVMEAVYDALMGYSLLDILREHIDSQPSTNYDTAAGMAILEVAIAEIGNRI